MNKSPQKTNRFVAVGARYDGPAVENEIYRVAQLVAYMLRCGRAQAPEAVGRGRRDAATERLQQLLRYGMCG